MTIVPVILAGGEGRRLAPLSTPQRPKAFVPLASGRTMLEETLARFQTPLYTKPCIVFNHRHSDLVKNYAARLLAEAEAHGTAFAIALAALYVRDENALMLVCPCDHAIADVAKFHDAIALGKPYAQDHHVLLGIEPHTPDTGFGYIHKGEAREENIFDVAGFKEKPDFETAKTYVDSGAYFWNAGIFLLSPSLILHDLQRHAPEIYEAALQSWEDRTQQDDTVYTAALKKECPRTSIDYAVLEKAENIVAVKLDTGWRDLGTFEALAEFLA